MKKLNKTVLASVLATTLVGCGGGGSSTSGSSTSGSTVEFTGKAIDGYITGATVYLDLNFNGSLDANEPNVITEGEGDFNLTVPSKYAQCAKYVPVVVDVPIGAIDLDYPDTPIEEAYQMTIAPQFTRGTNEELFNLTPLTTIVWQPIERQLKQDSTELSCDKILAEEELRSEIKTNLKEQEQRVAYRYNITVDDLYGDYVESGNTELHGFAKALVVPLQKSYAETIELQEAKPDSHYTYVEYYTDLEENPEHDVWYKRSFFSTANGFDYTEEYLDSEFEVKSLKERGVLETHDTTDELYQVSFTYTINDAGLTTCDVRDEWNIRTAESVGIVTRFNISSDDIARNISWDSCYSIEAENLTDSNAFYELTYVDYELPSTIPLNSGTFLYPYGSGDYSHLIGRADEISTAEVDALYAMFNSRDYYDTESYGSTWWNRMKQQFDGFDDDITAQIMYFHYEDRWERRNFYKDGTHNIECGLTETELSEANCSQWN